MFEHVSMRQIETKRERERDGTHIIIMRESVIQSV